MKDRALAVQVNRKTWQLAARENPDDIEEPPFLAINTPQRSSEEDTSSGGSGLGKKMFAAALIVLVTHHIKRWAAKK